MSGSILVFAGSIRKGSINRMLADCLTKQLAMRGADVEQLDLADYELPLFNADLALPEKAKALSEKFADSSALVIVSPEYNASLTPLIKNTLDWVSITTPAEKGSYGPFRNKICFIAACSPGMVGGLRGLYHLRAVLMNVGAEILSAQLAVGGGEKAFDETGGLTDPRTAALLQKGLDDLMLALERQKAIAPA